MTDTIMMSNRRYIERCEICGRFIADKELGLSAVKTSPAYMDGFVHLICLKQDKDKESKND